MNFMAKPVKSLLPEATIWGMWNKQSNCKTKRYKDGWPVVKELHEVIQQHHFVPSAVSSVSILWILSTYQYEARKEYQEHDSINSNYSQLY